MKKGGKKITEEKKIRKEQQAQPAKELQAEQQGEKAYGARREIVQLLLSLSNKY